MKASELIAQLQSFIAQHGDGPVVEKTRGLGGMSEDDMREIGGVERMTDGYYFGPFASQGHTVVYVITQPRRFEND